MTRKEQDNQLPRALARWDNEWGAIVGEGDDGRDALSREEQDVLQCLGVAVVAQWNKLPTAVQKALFEHAVSNADARECLDLPAGAHRALPPPSQERSPRPSLALALGEPKAHGVS